MKKKGKNIKSFTKNNLPKTKTSLVYLDSLSDKDIAFAVSSDPDAAPILDEAWFRKAKFLLHKQVKPVVSLRLSPSTIEWYKNHGKGHSGLMAQVLEHYAAAHMDDIRST